MKDDLAFSLYLLYLCSPSVDIGIDMPGMSMAARAAAGITIKGRILLGDGAILHCFPLLVRNRNQCFSRGGFSFQHYFAATSLFP